MQNQKKEEINISTMKAQYLTFIKMSFSMQNWQIDIVTHIIIKLTWTIFAYNQN